MYYNFNNNNNRNSDKSMLDALAVIAFGIAIFNTAIGLFNFSKNSSAIKRQTQIENKIDKLLDKNN